MFYHLITIVIDIVILDINIYIKTKSSEFLKNN